jgi:malic enzyme
MVGCFVGAGEAVQNFSSLFRRPVSLMRPVYMLRGLHGNNALPFSFPLLQIGCFIVRATDVFPHIYGPHLILHSHVFRQSFPNQDSMKANLESHVKSLERQADLKTLASRTDSDSLIDLIVVTDSEAVLGIGGEFAR